MKKIFLFLSCLYFYSTTILAFEQFIVLDQKALSIVQQKLLINSPSLGQNNEGLRLIKVNALQIPKISEAMHHYLNRCGGFMAFNTLNEAQHALAGTTERFWGTEDNLVDYAINQSFLIRNLFPEIQEPRMRQIIEKLSSYKNRYYSTQNGADASSWIFDQWKAATAHRSDVELKFIKHKLSFVGSFFYDEWKQPSVMLTIKGESEETIVIGGHIDSTAGKLAHAHKRAPGADDNASGVAVVTEALRVLAKSNYKPKKTIKFIAYAAEEVGLWGSKAIAKEMRQNDVPVVGVINLDMANFNGSDLDIILINDYTNKAQNAFLGSLLDTYLPSISWGYDQCGYACSDHASWHNKGYAASFPVGSRVEDVKRKAVIHTEHDTLENAGGDAFNAINFAKLAIAYLVELDR